jgi:ACR3 family arsenite transporter
LGRRLHGRRRPSRQAFSFPHEFTSRNRIGQGNSDQSPYRRPDLADDRADDDEGGLLRDTESAEKTRGHSDHPVHQLDGEALFDGPDRLDFFRHLFSAWISPVEANQYIAGAIILAAAPCTAMVFVWSYLTDGDPAYTLVQVSLNDLIMLFLFAPIVRFLVRGAASLSIPFFVLLYSVIAFIVIPLSVGALLRLWLIRRHGKEWFESVLLPKFAPVTILALLATLILIFAFQADNLTGKSFHVLLIAVPILLQVYFNSSLAYGLMRLFRVEYKVAAPGALIGASNFFELAVATSIALFGPGSGSALATVVGVLIEVPVMLSVCAACNRTRHWFPTSSALTH